MYYLSSAKRDQAVDLILNFPEYIKGVTLKVSINHICRRFSELITAELCCIATKTGFRFLLKIFGGIPLRHGGLSYLYEVWALWSVRLFSPVKQSFCEWGTP